MRPSHPVFPLAFLALGFCQATAKAQVVAVVSSKNQVTELTKNQVRDIFLGRANRLPNGTKVVPVDLTEGSPARDAFYFMVTGQSPSQIKAYWSKIIFTGRGQPPREFATGSEVRRFIANNPYAISYLDKMDLDASLKVLKIVP